MSIDVFESIFSSIISKTNFRKWLLRKLRRYHLSDFYFTALSPLTIRGLIQIIIFHRLILKKGHHILRFLLWRYQVLGYAKFQLITSLFQIEGRFLHFFKLTEWFCFLLGSIYWVIVCSFDIGIINIRFPLVVYFLNVFIVSILVNTTLRVNACLTHRLFWTNK